MQIEKGMQQLIVLTEEQLKAIVSETVKAELQDGFNTYTPVINQPEPDELLTREEAAKMLKVSLPTLHKWTVDHTVKGHTIGTRVRYWRKDVEEALKEICAHRTAV